MSVESSITSGRNFIGLHRQRSNWSDAIDDKSPSHSLRSDLVAATTPPASASLPPLSHSNSFKSEEYGYRPMVIRVGNAFANLARIHDFRVPSASP